MSDWRRKLHFTLRLSDVDRDLDDELDFHLEETVARLVGEGLPENEARREAAARFGDRDKHYLSARRIARRRFRARRAKHRLETLGRDARIACRSLLRRPTFSGSVILVLALGTAAATTVFSFTNAVLLRPLPYPESETLVRVEEAYRPETSGALPQRNLTRPDIAALRERTRALEGLAGFRPAPLTFSDLSGTRRIRAGWVDQELLAVLGVPPAAGRGFSRGEMIPGNDRVAIVGHGFWTSQFGGDPNLLGRTISLRHEPHTVVGIMPAGFDFPNEAEVWVPLAATPFTDRFHVVQAIGRLSPGASLDEAKAEAGTLLRDLAEVAPESHGQVTGARVRGWQDQLVAEVRPAMLALGAAVCLLLLLVCVNVAALLTSRSIDRERETALRRSLGASRGRLISAVLLESVMLSIAGGVSGFLLSRATLGRVVALSPPDLPARELVAADVRVALFAAGIALVSGVLAGLIPGLRRPERSGRDMLRSGGTGSVGSGGSRARGGALVAIEVGLATVLMVGAALLTNSFVRMLQVDTGLGRHDLLAVSLSTAPTSGQGENSRLDRYAELVRRAGALPGAGRVSLSLFPPLGGARVVNDIQPLGDDRPTGSGDPMRVLSVTPSYFDLVGVRLERGRAFRDSDHRDAPRVAIVSLTAARLLWEEDDPVGRQLEQEGETLSVVGVVADVRQEGPLESPPPLIYVPFDQYIGWGGGTLLIETGSDPMAMVPLIRGLVGEVDQRMVVDDIATIDQEIARAIAQPRFFTVLVAVFAILAGLLAMAGLYGIIACEVRSRFAEFGIRAVLGAKPRDNVGLIVRHGARYLLIGVVCGAAASLLLTRLLEGLLYGVQPGDPSSVLLAGTLMLAAGLAATLVPAALAARADPSAAIRVE